MFVCDVKDIEKFTANSNDRKNPSLTFSNGGKLFLSVQTENTVLITRSCDSGNSWSAPLAAVVLNGGETVFDSRLWVDPDNRLWFMWSVIPNNRVECAICADADSEKLVWGEVRTLDFGLMLSRPLVSIDGSYLFLSGVTKRELDARDASVINGKDKGLYVYETRDKGETFTLRSKPFANNVTFEAFTAIEKIIQSRPNGVDIVNKSFYTVYAQVSYGIAKLVSPDGGVGFRAENDSTFGSYYSQFDASTIGPLLDKKFVLVNNMHFAEGGKMCFCALFSVNTRGDSYQGVLELESPDIKVFYPDIAIFDGAVYVAYEREDGQGMRDIALSRFTEHDALAFEVVDSNSYLSKKVTF
ncbi:MAG: exo-alpha-sialidase [Ruminococcaceae bacterium]|nr:exo-alpha-sialidase [Oscillospiraceae bacterium]